MNSRLAMTVGWVVMCCVSGLAIGQVSSRPLDTREVRTFDPQAVELLDAVTKTYASFRTYQQDEAIQFTLTQPTGERTQKAHIDLIFEKPNRIMIKRDDLMMICDGKRFMAYHPRLEQYTERPAPKSLSADVLERALMVNRLDPVLLSLVDPQASETFLKRFTKLELGEETEQQGHRRRELRLESGREKRTLLVDVTTHCIIRQTISMPIPGVGRGQFERITEYQNVRINEPVAGGKFTIKFSDKARKVDRISYTRKDDYKHLNKPLPDIPLVSLFDASGEAVSPKTLLGKLTFVTVWASWCGPCRYELPMLEQLYQTYGGQGFVVLGINVDSKDNLATARWMARQMKLGFPIFWDSAGKMADALAVEGIPTLLIVDSDGKIIEAHEGVSPLFQLEFPPIVEAALGAVPSSQAASQPADR